MQQMDQTSSTNIPMQSNMNPQPMYPMQPAQYVPMQQPGQQITVINTGADVTNMPRNGSHARNSVNILCPKCQKCGPTRVEGEWCAVTTCYFIMELMECCCCWILMDPLRRRNVHHFCGYCNNPSGVSEARCCGPI